MKNRSLSSPSAQRLRFTVIAAFLLSIFATAAYFVISPPPARGGSANIVISEFRVRGPQGPNDEFIELYNLSASAVNIGGWKIKASSGSGAVSVRVTIPDGTTLNPGCHYLVTNTGPNGYSGAVTGDLTYSNGIPDDGGIAVTLADDTMVDQVGLSAGSAFKEGTPLASLGEVNSNQSYERKPGGSLGNGIDTDSNSSDFQLITPSTPQNSLTGCVNLSLPTNPSGVGAATPSVVAAEGQTLLTVAATPGLRPASTGITVTGNLTDIGGSATQQFYDDGTHGDAAANDNVFSFQATIATGTSPGAKSLPITITDAQSRTASAAISLNVPAVLAIHDIQGSGSASPHAGELVMTSGIVTGVKSDGFFMQTPDAKVDGDLNTSEGIFVFTSSTPPAAAAVGNAVTVTGTVQEFIPPSDANSKPLTEIAGSPVVALVSTGNLLPTPITLTAADLSSTGSVEQLEKFEGMRVHVDSLTAVSPTQGTIDEADASSTSNGVFYAVITGTARPFREPGIDVSNPLPPGSPSNIPRFDGNPERLRVASTGLVSANALEVTAGAIITNVTGPLDYASRAYTILPEPASPPTVINNLNAIKAAPVQQPTSDEFTIASFNMGRFYDDVNDPAINEPVLTTAAFNVRLSKASLAIRNVMRLPDIIGVQEVENLATLQAVANKVNSDAVAAGGPNPNYQAFLEKGNDASGLDVGFLVKIARVAVVEVTQVGKDSTYINPNTGTSELLNDHPPLVLRANIQRPSASSFPVTVIVNHLRPLSGVDDPTEGNRIRTKRKAQAEYLAGLIQTRQAANSSESIVSLGDYNAYQFSDGYVDVIGTVKGAPAPADQVVLASSSLVNPGLTDLVDLIPPDQRYSSTSDGNAQALDHVLVNKNMLARVSRMLQYARDNADFPESLRRDEKRPERISDRDMPVAYFSFPGLAADLAVTKTTTRSTITTGSTVTYSIAVTNNGPDPATDMVVSDQLPANLRFQSLNAPAASVKFPEGWSCTVPSIGESGLVKCTTPSMIAGATATFLLTVSLDCSIPNGTAIAETVMVTSSTSDPETKNNSSTATITASNPTAISPAGDTFGFDSGSGSVSVTVPTGCSWTAKSNADWIVITSGASGTGHGTVEYAVDANPTANPRTGTMTIAGLTFAVAQSGVVCSYKITQTSVSFLSSAGTGLVGVSAPAGCSWTAKSNADWITITSGESGNGSGPVNYSVAANPNFSPRDGTLTIAGQTFTVSQAGIPCTYSISPASQNFGAAGGTNTVAVTAAGPCSWIATNSIPWVTITSGASGSGNGTVTYSVAANSQAIPRSGTFTVAGKAFTVTQDGVPCTYTVAPLTASVDFTAATGSVTVTVPGGCNWTAGSNVPFITITSGGNSSGSGTVNYSVLANPNTSLRTGTMSIAGQTVTVTQAAAPCIYTLSATSQAFTTSGGSGVVGVSSSTGCAWTAESHDSWVAITFGQSGNGQGTVSFSVAANNSGGLRNSKLTIAGQTFTVYQAVDFSDVPSTNQFYTEISKLYARGITSGCGGGSFCPNAVVTREQMAIFIIKALGLPNPPTPDKQRFGDVPPTRSGYAFIEELARRGITVGCGNGGFCPDDQVTREQMAIFLIRALGEFNPATPVKPRFIDVPQSKAGYPFIEELSRRGITQGCGGNFFCPDSPVTRGQMAAFLVRAFGL